MKIVVNRCFGGFGLSVLAIKRYLELSGKECWFYEHISSGSLQPSELRKIDSFKKDSGYSLFALTKDYGDKVLSYIIDWSSDHFCDYEADRTDPVLVQVVEELGSKKASGKFAELEVVEIPDDVEWTISDYDGVETIEEAHRSW